MKEGKSNFEIAFELMRIIYHKQKEIKRLFSDIDKTIADEKNAR